MGNCDFSFSKKERLRKRKEFLEVYDKGQKVKTKFFFLYFLESGLTYSRLGITASRKTGKQVDRNWAKRRLREVFRRHKKSIFPPCDLVINTTRSTISASYNSLEEEFLEAVKCWRRG